MTLQPGLCCLVMMQRPEKQLPCPALPRPPPCSQTLQHPSIVRTLTFAWEESSPDPYEWGSGSQWGQSQGHYSAVTDPASLASLDSPLLSSADGGNIFGRQIQQMWIVQEVSRLSCGLLRAACSVALSSRR